MRALVISTAVVGAMVLTGCQSTGNNLGGMEYDKTALGTSNWCCCRLWGL